MTLTALDIYEREDLAAELSRCPKCKRLPSEPASEHFLWWQWACDDFGREPCPYCREDANVEWLRKHDELRWPHTEDRVRENARVGRESHLEKIRASGLAILSPFELTVNG